MSNAKYTAVMDAWLTEKVPLMKSQKAVTDSFNARFAVAYTSDSIRGRYCRLGLRTANKARYTPEHDCFLAECISAMSYNKLRVAFNERFDTSLSVNAIQHRCARLGIDHGYAGRQELIFERGKKNPFSPRKPIGAETVSAGKTYVKVTDENTMSGGKGHMGDGRNWVEKKRFVYKGYHGDIPSDGFIVHLNGDRNDYGIDNLFCVSRGVNMMMSQNRWYSDNRERTLTAIKLCELILLTKGCLKR